MRARRLGAGVRDGPAGLAPAGGGGSRGAAGGRGGRPGSRIAARLSALLLLTASPGGAAAQETAPPEIAPPEIAQEAEEGAEEPGWNYAAELTFVLTSGNARSSTFGVGSNLRRLWENAELTVEGSAIRTRSEIVERRAEGTPEDFRVVEETESRLTAEKYRADVRLDRDLGGTAFLYGGVSWLRNTFAGLESRFTFLTGTGHTWAEGETMRFKTGVAATYTFQEDVLSAAAASDRFAGARLNANFFRRLTETTRLTSELVVDENLDDTADLRADLTNALQVAINDHLALKTSWQLVFDNRPSFTSVPLETPAGDPTGEEVAVRLEEVDSFLTLALVVTF